MSMAQEVGLTPTIRGPVTGPTAFPVLVTSGDHCLRRWVATLCPAITWPPATFR